MLALPLHQSRDSFWGDEWIHLSTIMVTMVTQKAKLFVLFIRHNVMKTYEEAEVLPHTFIISGANGGK
jgi:hypothetical protein